MCLILSAFVWFCLNLPESVWVCVNLYESVWICLSLCEFVWVCLSLSEPSLPESVSVFRCLGVSLSLCSCVCVNLCPCVPVSLCLCVFASLCLCVSVSLCLCDSVSLSLWVSVLAFCVCNFRYYFDCFLDFDCCSNCTMAWFDSADVLFGLRFCPKWRSIRVFFVVHFWGLVWWWSLCRAWCALQLQEKFIFIKTSLCVSSPLKD